ncbi:MAG TPA: CBS domain-containing protein, partial [bacterium]|nr:CBS domain-containing protein [bacterium]
AGTAPELHPAVTCHAEQTVREVGNQFIASPANIVVVLDPQSNAVTGIVTLHDLLRAQAAIES